MLLNGSGAGKLAIEWKSSENRSSKSRELTGCPLRIEELLVGGVGGGGGGGANL